jgi:hypothetical protein
MQNQNNSINIANLQQQIMQNEIIPSYNKEIKDGLAMRIYWDKLSTRFFTASISLGTIAGIIAFAAGATIFAKNSGDLTFLSGCCSSFGTACIIFSRHCESQCKESTKKVNTILTALGVSIQVPDIPSDVIDSQVAPTNNIQNAPPLTRLNSLNTMMKINNNLNNMSLAGLTSDTINSITKATTGVEIPEQPDIEMMTHRAINSNQI